MKLSKKDLATITPKLLEVKPEDWYIENGKEGYTYHNCSVEENGTAFILYLHDGEYNVAWTDIEFKSKLDKYFTKVFEFKKDKAVEKILNS